MRLNLLLLILGIALQCQIPNVSMAQGHGLDYLFSHSSSVELLSYRNRMYNRIALDDDDEEGKTPTPVDTTFFVVADLRIQESTIREKVMLTSSQRKSLFRLLSKDLCKADEVAMCYDPRHAVIFYDASSKPYSYIEICFECFNYQTSENRSIDMCDKKSRALNKLFQSFGIKYYGECEP